jgi:hypothetical protein
MTVRNVSLTANGLRFEPLNAALGMVEHVDPVMVAILAVMG